MANPEYKTITAQYKGQCSVCRNRINPGDRIKYAKGSPALHATCETPEIPADAIQLSQGSGYAGANFAGWQPQTVIRNPNPRTYTYKERLFHCPACKEDLTGNTCLKGEWKDGHRAVVKEEKVIEKPGPGANQPEFLYVITSTARYVREDGLSFGVGDDSGYIYSATCRPATEEESAPLREAIAKAEARRAAQADLRDLYVALWRDPAAEWPEKVERIEGERVTVSMGHYQTNEQFVISADYLWLVTYNGRDGDDWRPNNYGGHSIARRLDVDPDSDLANKIRTLFIAASGAPKGEE